MCPVAAEDVVRPEGQLQHAGWNEKFRTRDMENGANLYEVSPLTRAAAQGFL